MNPHEIYAFSEGMMVNTAEGTLKLSCVHAGELICPSGKLVVGDAFLLRDAIPFDIAVKPGRFKAIATLGNLGTQNARVVYLSILLSASQPSDWKTAKPKAFRGDNSIACFADTSAAKLWDTCFEKEGEQESWQRLLREFKVAPGTPFVDFTIDHTQGKNLIAWDAKSECFGSCFYGCDEKGKVLCITVDTGLLAVG